MVDSFVKLINSVIDSYMEGFETAFPAVVEKVNGDGTVDVTPSIRNVLKNMQIEPDGEDGKPLPVESVPVLWPGTSAAIVKFELAKGDPLLCVSSSRDLRAWVEGGESKGPFNPLSFSGNDLNDMIAIPMSRGGSKKVTVTIGRDGNVSLEADSVTVTAGSVKVDGELEVTGGASFGEKVNAADFSTPLVSLNTHLHYATAPYSPVTTPYDPANPPSPPTPPSE
jgi:hypothetical protein